MLLLIAVCITGIALVIVALVAQNLRLQGEIADMRRTWRPRNVGGKLGWIAVPSGDDETA